MQSLGRRSGPRRTTRGAKPIRRPYMVRRPAATLWSTTLRTTLCRLATEMTSAGFPTAG